jgi:hypothetical protein
MEMTIKADYVKCDIITHVHKIVANGAIIIPPHDFAHPSPWY